MEALLIEFIDTLDLSLKKVQREASASSEFSQLTISQLQYIDAIDALHNPTISEVAARLDVTKSSATVGIKKLVKMKYVEKRQSKEDRRVFHVSLTTAGKRLVQAKYQALRRYGDFIRSALTDEEAKQFKEIIAKLVALFKSTDAAVPPGGQTN